MIALQNNRRGLGLWGILVAGVIAFGHQPAAAAPILEYKFNETGLTAPSTGTDTTALSLYNAANAATDLHGATNSGLSGLSSDRCLDQSTAAGMGSTPGTADLSARHSADLDAIDGLQSFTLSGWFKTSVPEATIGGNAVLIDNAPNSSVTNGFRLSCSGTLLTLEVDNGSVSSTGGLYDDKNRWTFFAVTYDGTLSVNNVRFYRGYRTGSEARQRPILGCVATGTLDKATVENDIIALYVGNRTTRVRPFKGYLDNIRIHGSKTDASGALSAGDLETLRATDVVDVADSRMLLEYKFNETGTNAPSTGLYGNPLLLESTNGVGTDYHGAAGTGVLGIGDDRALDFTVATAWGNNGIGPVARQAADDDAFDILMSFTLSGWFKTEPGSPIDRYAKVFNSLSSLAGYEVMAQGGQLILNVDNVQNSAAYGETGKWVFFGLTYDGSLTTNNVKFYKGFRTKGEGGGSSAVSCIATATADKGTTEGNATAMTIGNLPSPYNRPFKGYLDNLRLHASYQDDAGALSQAQLEALRAADYNISGTVFVVR